MAGLVALARAPLRTALLTGALLAQAGEFSFVLARLGAERHALTGAVFSLLLTAAVLSIVLAPALYRAAGALATWVETCSLRPLASVPADPTVPVDQGLQGLQGLQGHAVICGYGRVGRVIVDALRLHLPVLVVEQDPRAVRALRAQGWPGVTALVGDAANAVVLDRLRLPQARLLVAAIPDARAVRTLVASARRVNPALDIVVRTHSRAERDYLARFGVSESVVGELELAREMTRYALHHLDTPGSAGTGARPPRADRPADAPGSTPAGPPLSAGAAAPSCPGRGAAPPSPLGPASPLAHPPPPGPPTVPGATPRA